MNAHTQNQVSALLSRMDAFLHGESSESMAIIKDARELLDVCRAVGIQQEQQITSLEASLSQEAQSGVAKLGAAIEHALDTCSVSDVLSIITGTFVSLTVELCRRAGHDVTLPIKVDGVDERDITIHAPKSLGPTDKKAGS